MLQILDHDKFEATLLYWILFSEIRTRSSYIHQLYSSASHKFCLERTSRIP